MFSWSTTWKLVLYNFSSPEEKTVLIQRNITVVGFRPASIVCCASTTSCFWNLWWLISATVAFHVFTAKRRETHQTKWRETHQAKRRQIHQKAPNQLFAFRRACAQTYLCQIFIASWTRIRGMWPSCSSCITPMHRRSTLTFDLYKVTCNPTILTVCDGCFLHLDRLSQSKVWWCRWRKVPKPVFPKQKHGFVHK